MNDFSRRTFITGVASAASAIRSAAAPLPSPAPDAAWPPVPGLDMSAEAVLTRRREALDALQQAFGLPRPEMGRNRLNSVDKNWEAWQKRTGELPPDFAAMPSNPFLPDPLLMDPFGKKLRVQNREDWERQRVWLKDQCQDWLLGRMPPPPGNVRSQVTQEKLEGDVRTRLVTLEFGPEHKGVLHLQVSIPPGNGPFPVLVTNHPRSRPWVNTAVRRGWIGCIPAAADTLYIGSDDAEKWLDLYPDCTWGSVARWAWGAMRAVDYLWTLPEVDRARIVSGGHSRNSKSALVAAAFDERFAGAIPSRGNTGDGNAWRLTSPVYMNEPMEELTGGMPQWFHPRLRFFCGREHKLPVDTNLIMALVAPRALILSHAFTEHQGSALAIEQAYRSVSSVYRLLGVEQKIALYQQPGEHASTCEDMEQYLDFMDSVFGRKNFPKPENWVHGYSYAKWLQTSGERIDPSKYPARNTGDFARSGANPVQTPAAWSERRRDIQKRIQWALGEEPPALPYFPEREKLFQYGMTSDGWMGQLLQRNVQGMEAFQFPYGDDLSAELYAPEQVVKAINNFRIQFYLQRYSTPLGAAGNQPAAQPAPSQPSLGKYPVVIWLHPYSYATGYSRYAFWNPLVKQGFLVLTLDQIGFGSRNLQALRFYQRYPKWSLLGKMIADTRAAVENLSRLDIVDPDRIYLAGYALGAKVALFTAALDDRVAGAVSACGFYPLRRDNPANGAEGVRHYSHLHGLMPRLGAFVGQERRLPIDYDEIIAAASPKPLYLYAPTLDRFNPIADVKAAVDAAREIYRIHGREGELVLESPVNFNQFDGDQQRTGLNWLSQKAGLGELPEPSPGKL